MTERVEPPTPSYTGATPNPEDTRSLRNAVGSFLVNMGTIEMYADVWLSALTTDRIAAVELLECRLSIRVELIERFIKAGRLSKEFAAGAALTWSRAKKLVELRNDVAHGALLFGGRGQDGATTDFVGVRKKGKRGKPHRMIPLADVGSAAHASASVCQELFALGRQIEAVNGWPTSSAGSGQD